MVHLDVSQIKKIKVRDYAIRFAFGGVVSLLAAFIAQQTNSRIGGVFTAFPAILLASLTLINQEEGGKQARADAQGGVVGAIALVVAAFVLSVSVRAFAGGWSLMLTLALWLACSIALYELSVKCGWLRPEQEKQSDDTDGGR